MNDRLENGLVIRVTGGDVWVQVGDVVLACTLRGRFRVKQKSLQVVAGDQARVLRDAGSGASIEEILPRRSWLSRYVERDGAERLTVANVDQLFVVVSVGEPPIHAAFLDQMLAAAEWGQAPAVLVLNKVDLASGGEIPAFRDVYEAAGYEVIETSAARGSGVDALGERVGTGIYAFVGESGVGKSSLLNRLDPEFDLDVRDVGGRTGRGRHTTTFSQLFPFRTGYLADTPGMQTFRFPGNDENAVAGCFPEMARVTGRCRFATCTHTHEPGCAVKAALDAGDIRESRYKSYLEIMADVRARTRNRAW
jgi:ribosome biogenesis GTPase / thiamine phosphate phosphatase